MLESDTQILNKIAVSSGLLHQLSEQESLDLKIILLGMYRDILNLCNNNNLKIMLGGGSCLGAIRHGGFIPWDDDLDLMMTREDYEKLLVLLEKDSLGANYEYESPSKTKDSKTNFLKIYKKNTLDNEIWNALGHFPKGIFIDVFPIDFASNYKLIRKIHGFISDTLQFIAVSVLYSQYRSDIMKKYMLSDSKGAKRYKFRLLIGNFFNIFSHNKWVYWFDKYNHKTRETKYMTIPTGRKHYVGETLPSNTFLKVTEVMFEGIPSSIPMNYNLYLRNLYNDYMKLPKYEDRERHFVYEFSTDNKE